MAILKPSPGAPISAEAGTRTRSNFSRASGCGAITSMRSATERPAVIGRAREKLRGPLHPELPRFARTPHRSRQCRRWRSRFFRRRERKRRRRGVAVMAKLATSEPDFASVRAKAAIASPERVRLSQSRCSAAAEQADRAGAEPLHGKREIGKPVMPRQRFANEAERSHIERGRRVGIGCGVRKEAVAAELLHEIAAGRIDVAMRDRQIGRAPALDRLRQRAMAIGEERPGRGRSCRPLNRPRIPVSAWRRRPDRRARNLWSACRSLAPALRPRWPDRGSSTIPD